MAREVDRGDADGVACLPSLAHARCGGRMLGRCGCVCGGRWQSTENDAEYRVAESDARDAVDASE